MSDLLFYGGPILTMEAAEDGPAARAQALLVQNGRITGRGSKEELLALCPAARQIDLEGRCLMPGFFDAHSHMLQFANTLQYCNLSDVGSFDELKQTMTRFMESQPEGETGVVIGFGYDQNRMAEGRHPDRYVLDEISNTRPVMISHASGHMGVANSVMLQALGLTDAVKDPQGGRFGRDAQGHLDGLLEENAFLQRTSQTAAAPDPAAQQAKTLNLLDQAQQIYFSYGITTAQEGMLHEDDFASYRELASQGRLKMDVVGYADLRSCADLPDRFPEYRETYKDHFKVGGYKLFLDGSPQGRTAWMLEDYADEAGYKGYPAYTDQEVENFVAQAQQANLQLLCHCNGDAAADQFIRAHKQPSTRRDVMIHAQFLHPEQMPAMKAAGIMPSFFTAHSWYWGDAHIQHMGMERAKGISAAASAKALGIPYTFHMDTPVLPPDCMDAVFCAVNRITRNGVKLDQSECLSAYDALLGITRYAAWQYFEEDEKGTLTPGKAADLVILSADPTAVDSAALREVQILATFKNGDCVYHKA